MVGEGELSTTATIGVDFELLYGILEFSISSYRFSMSAFVRFGGRGGNVVGSKTGGIILPESIDGVLDDAVLDAPLEKADIDGALDVDLLAVPFDSADIEEILDVEEDTDSAESRLVSCCSDGLLGGKAGEA